MRRLPLLVLPLLLFAAACGSDDNGPVASGDLSTTTTSSTLAPPNTAESSSACSTSTIRVQLAGQDLPAAVAAKRKAIFDAAVACDYRALAALAGLQFSYTFGDVKGDVSAYWHKQEDDGVPVLSSLVQVLNLPSVDRQQPDGGATYTSWPSADQDVRTQADWDALKGLYTDEQIAGYQKDDFYTGYRTAITESGDWMYFVTGD